MASSRPEGWPRRVWEAMRECRAEHGDLSSEETFLLGKVAAADPDAVEACLRERKESRADLGDVLVRRGLVTPEELTRIREGLPDFPRYEVRERLGQGATAVVYRAWDRELQRGVALKVLREVAAASDVARERFRREAQAMAGLSHPHLVTIYDAGEHEGRPYLVMEVVEGCPLSAFFAGRRPSPSQSASMLEKAARGVAAAHAKGIVHRDLKPGNILISPAGEPKVGDFGLAHLSHSAAELTRTGAALGTPLYMSPEQVEGRIEEIAPSTDVYALGVVLYEALAGRPPFTGESEAEIYGKIAREDPAPIPGVPVELEAIALKALEKSPSRRYSDAGAFADDLERWARGESPVASPRTAWTAAGRSLSRHRGWIAASLALLAAAAFWSTREWTAASAERDFEQGLELWHRGRAAEALDRLAEAARKRPSRAETWLLIGRCERDLGRGEKALAAWTRALDLDPTYSPARFERGKHFMDEYVRARRTPAVSGRAGRARTAPVDAEDDGARARRLRAEEDLQQSGPEVAGRRYLQGAFLFGQGRYPESAAALAEYARENPRDGPAFALAGLASYYAGDLAAAERLLSDAVRLEGRASWFKARGDARFLQGKYADALADYTQADVPDSQGLALQGLGRFKEAAAEHTRAIERAPERAEAYNNRAIARASGADPGGAEEDLQRALQLRPLYAEAFNNLGSVRALRGEFDEALKEYDAALAIDPCYDEAWLNRAKTRKLKGDRDGARADLRRALEVAPPNWTGRVEAERLLRE